MKELDNNIPIVAVGIVIVIGLIKEAKDYVDSENFYLQTFLSILILAISIAGLFFILNKVFGKKSE